MSTTQMKQSCLPLTQLQGLQVRWQGQLLVKRPDWLPMQTPQSRLWLTTLQKPGWPLPAARWQGRQLVMCLDWLSMQAPQGRLRPALLQDWQMRWQDWVLVHYLDWLPVQTPQGCLQPALLQG